MIDLEKLDFEFISKPLLIGGKAMEHYGLRKAGADIDFVITTEDYERLACKYPNDLREIGGDWGSVCSSSRFGRAFACLAISFFLWEPVSKMRI